MNFKVVLSEICSASLIPISDQTQTFTNPREHEESHGELNVSLQLIRISDYLFPTAVA